MLVHVPSRDYRTVVPHVSAQVDPTDASPVPAAFLAWQHLSHLFNTQCPRGGGGGGGRAEAGTEIPGLGGGDMGRGRGVVELYPALRCHPHNDIALRWAVASVLVPPRKTLTPLCNRLWQ